MLTAKEAAAEMFRAVRDTRLRRDTLLLMADDLERAIVDRPAPTPAPGLDLDAVERAAASFAKYHTEHARFGGASREFHERAETFIGATVPALIAEVRSLRGKLAEARDLIGNTEHESTCAIGPYNAGQNGADCSCAVGAIAAALEAL